MPHLFIVRDPREGKDTRRKGSERMHAHASDWAAEVTSRGFLIRDANFCEQMSVGPSSALKVSLRRRRPRGRDRGLDATQLHRSSVPLACFSLESRERVFFFFSRAQSDGCLFLTARDASQGSFCH